MRETGEKGCVLVTIDDDGRVRREFHRLDVLRWEIAHIDATNMTEEADLLEQAEQKLDDLIHEDDDHDRPLAVRVRILGTSSLSDRLRSQADRFVNEIRGLTQSGGRERIWIEKVEIKTRPVRDVAFLDGPIEVIQEVLAQVRENPTVLGSEFADLRRKLSAVLMQDADEFPIGDPAWIQDVLEEVSPLLSDLLLHPDRPGRP